MTTILYDPVNWLASAMSRGSEKCPLATGLFDRSTILRVNDSVVAVEPESPQPPNNTMEMDKAVSMLCSIRFMLLSP